MPPRRFRLTAARRAPRRTRRLVEMRRGTGWLRLRAATGERRAGYAVPTAEVPGPTPDPPPRRREAADTAPRPSRDDLVVHAVAA